MRAAPAADPPRLQGAAGLVSALGGAPGWGCGCLGGLGMIGGGLQLNVWGGHALTSHMQALSCWVHTWSVLTAGCRRCQHSCHGAGHTSPPHASSLTLHQAATRHPLSRRLQPPLGAPPPLPPPRRDTPAPTLAQIEEGVQWALQQKAAGRPVLVHCAHGHGRSATVLAAILIAEGRVQGVAEAEALMKKERPWVRLNRRQHGAVGGWLERYFQAGKQE